MSKRPSRHMVQRAVAVLVALLFGVFGMDVASLVRIQLIQADEYRSKAESQQLSDTEIQPQRGLIYDRNKKVLAQSANVWLVYINPSKIPNDKVREAISEGLAEILEMDKETILKKAQKSNYGYVAVKKQIEKEMKILFPSTMMRSKKLIRRMCPMIKRMPIMPKLFLSIRM